MSGFGPRAHSTEQDVRDVSAVKQLPFGSVRFTRDGKQYRYGAAGAVDLAPGKMNVAAASVANHTNLLVQTAVAVGSRKVNVTLGATAATASQYADGRLVITSAAGAGIEYSITDHTAVVSGGVLTAKLDEPVKVALVGGTSRASLTASPWSAVIVAPATVSNRPVGVNNVTIPAGNSGWFQTHGDCSVLSDGIITKGSGAILSDAVPGALEIEVAATIGARVGRAPEATVDTQYYLITLEIE